MIADTKRSARLLAVVVGPFFVAGLLLTVSIYGAIGGLPLAISAGLVLRAVRRAWKMPEDRRRRRALRVAAIFTSLAMSVSLAGVLAFGGDDLDIAPEFIGLVIALAWIALAWRSVAILGRPRD